MPLFGGFKKTFRLKSLIKPSKENGNIGEPICGAYRINREEFLSNNDPTKRNTSPIVQMTYNHSTLKHAHSSDNVLSNRQLPNTRQSMPDIAQPEPAPRKSKHEREQRRIDKQQVERNKLEQVEQKKEKLVLKEREIQQMNKEHETIQKKERKEQKKEQKKEIKPDKKALKVKSKKNIAPQPQVIKTATAPLLVSNIPQASNYSTNTLDSSISRTSGPPPYTEEPNITLNKNDNTGNTSFAAPTDEFGSWDLISEHRQQLNRPKATTSGSKQIHMDLRYNMIDMRDNSEV